MASACSRDMVRMIKTPSTPYDRNTSHGIHSVQSFPKHICPRSHHENQASAFPPSLPHTRLRELHLELGSMSIAEQRSLIRGLSSSGLLPQLEKVTLGDGTTSYVRSPGRGPGRDLFAVSSSFFRKTCTFFFNYVVERAVSCSSLPRNGKLFLLVVGTEQ